MKKTLLISIIAAFFLACGDSDDSIEPVATLRIVNAIQDVETIQLRDFEGNVSFFNTTTLDYGANGRFAFAPNRPIDITVVPESDTLRVILNETITLENQGGIFSFFLYGDSTQVRSLLIQDEFTNYQDSVFGVRFINLSADSNPVSIRNIALDTAGFSDTISLASDMEFQGSSEFSRFEVTSRIVSHTFQFLDATNNVLASLTIPESSFVSPPYFKNITLGLAGRTNNGAGGSNLSVIEIEHFE